MVSKYCEFPYRCIGRCRCWAARVSPGLARRRAAWAGRTCWWLTPIYDLVVGTVLSSTKLFADGTTLPVLDPGRGPDQGLDGCWCYAVDDRPWCGPSHPAAAYVYSEDRKGAHPAGHLASFSGVYQVDGYAGFKRLAGDRGDFSVCHESAGPKCCGYRG